MFKDEHVKNVKKLSIEEERKRLREEKETKNT